MKKISVLLAFLALLVANFAFAQGAAVVTSVTGSAQVQTGAAPTRALRQGDEVRQGDTVSTGANSSLVLKFDDGEVAALAQNSRMTVTAYQYQPEARTGNVLLSLITGGMRAITGLIGRTQPERVAYRAATTTIGIRGTDVSIATNGTDVEITVNSGSIMVMFNGTDHLVTAGMTVHIHNNVFSSGPMTGPAASTLGFAITQLQGMTEAINNALQSAGSGDGTPGTGTGSTGSPNMAPGGGGGGSASVH